jgi:glutamate-1-semialdehyde 2,1-aminomutase
VSAIAGRADLMQLMEKIFFSFTFGGELLSLAAAKATLQKLKREPVVKTIHNQGQKLMSALKQRLESHDMHDLLSLAGSPSWSFLLFKDSNGYGQFEIKTLFLQEVFARGILAIGTHNMSYAHSDNDIASLMTVYDEVFPIIKDAVKQKTLKEKLKAPALEPLFKIR